MCTQLRSLDCLPSSSSLDTPHASYRVPFLLLSFFFFFSDKFEGKCQVIFAAEGNPYVVYDTALEVYPVLLQSMWFALQQEFITRQGRPLFNSKFEKQRKNRGTTLKKAIGTTTFPVFFEPDFAALESPVAIVIFFLPQPSASYATVGSFHCSNGLEKQPWNLSIVLIVKKTSPWKLLVLCTNGAGKKNSLWKTVYCSAGHENRRLKTVHCITGKANHDLRMSTIEN